MNKKTSPHRISLTLRLIPPLLSVSLLSLLLSYIFFSSDPWKTEFQNYGWIIESSRSIIWVSSGYYLLATVFKDESVEISKYITDKRKHSRKNRTLVNFIRTFGLIFEITVLYLLVTQHIVWGPKTLLEIHPIPIQIIDQDKYYFSQYRLPYLLYLPYSLINHIIIGVPLCIVGTFASIKDLIRIRERKNNLQAIFGRDKIYRINTRKHKCLNNNSYSCQKIVQEFHGFGFDFIDIVGRYSSLVLVVSVIFSFEYWIGRITLSDLGWKFALIGYSLSTFALFLVILAFSFYSNVFSECTRRLFEIGCDDFNSFENENGGLIIMRRILKRNLNLYLAILFFLFLPPFTSITNAILEHF